MTDPRIEIIRTHQKVGRGSCTNIDEAFSDKDLAKDLDRNGITTPSDALKWALEFEGLKVEAALNSRWGEDDDPQLAAWNKWNDDQERTND